MDERYARELIMLIARFCSCRLTSYMGQALTPNTLLLVNVTPKENLNYKVLETSKKKRLVAMDEPQKSPYCQKVIKVNYFSYYGNAFCA